MFFLAEISEIFVSLTVHRAVSTIDRNGISNDYWKIASCPTVPFFGLLSPTASRCAGVLLLPRSFSPLNDCVEFAFLSEETGASKCRD